MKKVKNQKKLFWHIQVDLKQNWNNFFYVITQSQKSLPAYTAHTLAEIKWYVSGPSLKKNNFLFQPPSPLHKTLHDIKIIKIEEIENLTLGHLYIHSALTPFAKIPSALA
jgi:hypothetical protein